MQKEPASQQLALNQSGMGTNGQMCAGGRGFVGVNSAVMMLRDGR